MDHDLIFQILERGGSADPANSARRILGEFGSAAAAVATGPDRLRSVCVDDPSAVDAVLWFAEAMRTVLRLRIAEAPVLGGSSELAEYVRFEMANLRYEQVRVLFLSAGNRLMADEVVSWGGVAEACFDVRHVATRALEIGAAALIVVHNHPSGDARPSARDLRSTREFVSACAVLGIQVHDHLVVSTSGVSSLRDLGALA